MAFPQSAGVPITDSGRLAQIPRGRFNLTFLSALVHTEAESRAVIPTLGPTMPPTTPCRGSRRGQRRAAWAGRVAGPELTSEDQADLARPGRGGHGGTKSYGLGPGAQCRFLE